jgi:signal transduction histidine kinase/DNA-binding response OmpR family regulator
MRLLSLSACFAYRFRSTYKCMKRILFCLLISGLIVTTTLAQVLPLSLTLDSLQNRYSLRYKLWLYHPGHDTRWANPSFDDRTWIAHYSWFDPPQAPSGWNGTGWFRLHFVVDSSLVGRQLAMRVRHRSASEIYLDGEKIGSYGKIGNTPSTNQDVRTEHELLAFQFTRPGPHVLAVRVSANQPYYSRENWTEQGISLQIGLTETMTQLVVNLARLFSFPLALAFATGLFALLHLILFISYPSRLSNLYYSGWLLLITVDAVCAYLDHFLTDPVWQDVVGHLAMVANFSIAVTSVAFIYSVYYTRQPRQIWVFCTIAILLSAFLWLSHSVLPYPVLYGFLLVCTLEVARVVIQAIRRRQPGVWLIGMGVLAVAITFFTGPANSFYIWHLNNIDQLYRFNLFITFGYLVLPLCTSIYLAQDVARINRNLETQLDQVRELSGKTLAQEAEKLQLVAEQKEQLEQTVQERTEQLQQQTDKLREMNRVKSHFFTNLTHEFRTPLTLMLGPAEQVLAQTQEPTTKQQVGLLQRNAQRLLRLINQLLELSKLEAGKSELVLTPSNVVPLVSGTLHSFESLAAQKRITLQFTSDCEQRVMAIDRPKLEAILYNLMSNALKFTPADGRVSVALACQQEDQSNWIELRITDTGIGIRAEKLPYVFDRFYQVDASDTREQEGTGIGLALTKELVELHDGTIQITSQEGIGTTVIVRLPVREERTIKTTEAAPEQPITASPDFPSTALTDRKIKPLEWADESATENPSVLIIEDNDEVRTFIGSSLGDGYRILEAGNGEEGVRLAQEHIPDLVITDLMMPRLNGYQVCTILKQDARTSHIPVIMLTARADLESKIEGLQTGADSYLAKPFHQRELLAQITNLLRIRQQLHEHYNRVTLDRVTPDRVTPEQGEVWRSGETSLPSMEQVFLDGVRTALETHLDDEQYSVDRLCEEVGLGRTQLHRKLKALINQTPGDLLRILRLQRAHQLLRANVGTVAEVAYLVGYGNPANFSTSFSRHFGYAPSEVRKKTHC